MFVAVCRLLALILGGIDSRVLVEGAALSGTAGAAGVRGGRWGSTRTAPCAALHRDGFVATSRDAVGAGVARLSVHHGAAPGLKRALIGMLHGMSVVHGAGRAGILFGSATSWTCRAAGQHLGAADVAVTASRLAAEAESTGGSAAAEAWVIGGGAASTESLGAAGEPNATVV